MKLLTKAIIVCFSDLRHKSRLIPTIRDYFGGIAHSELIVPNHILLFSRLHRRDLPVVTRPIDHHHRFVLIVNLETPGRLGIDRHIIHLPEKHAVFVFPHQFHGYLDVDRDETNWLFITFELERAESLQPLRNVRIPLSGELLRRIDQVVGCYLAGGGGDHGVNNRLALLTGVLIEELLQTVAQAVAPEGSAANETRAQKMIERVHRVLFRRPGERVSVGDIARELNISESHLRTLFRRNIGLSLGRYIRESRLMRASGLIHNSDLNFSEIATQCGFDSIYTFSRAFKRAHGVSPSEYRKFLRKRSEEHEKRRKQE